MKIYFSNVNFSSTTGPNSFAYRLANQLNIDGHIIADKSDYDIALVFIESDGTIDANKPFVHRLDGLWFKPSEFLWKNKLIKKTYEMSAGVIFQSEFNKTQITTWWGAPLTYAVINNGIDITQQTCSTLEACSRFKNEYEKIFICSANWHPQKRLNENIRFYKHIRNTYQNSCLIVLGSNPDCIISDPHIFYMGSMSHEQCIQLYAISDWMIHLAWLDHCPNTVVEAISQGTPVICSSDGGTREIVKNNGILIDEKIKYNYTLQNYDNPPLLPDNFGGVNILPEISIDSSYLDIKNVAQHYVNFLHKVKSKICV